MIELGALVIVGGVVMAWFLIQWAILDYRWFRQKEAWRTDPNFKWNWD